MKTLMLSFVILLVKSEASGLRKTILLYNSLAHITTWLRSDLKLLVLDATTGQSGLNQAKVFKEIGDISGIILTKMDGTSKGGIILAIKDIFDIPVKFIGLGESLDDLAPFDLEMFITAITKDLDI